MLRTLTHKQTDIIKVLIAEESFEDKKAAELMDLDQIIEAVHYDVTKEAIQFSLRSLRKRGFIEKSDETELRRGRKRILWYVTELGQKSFRRIEATRV